MKPKRRFHVLDALILIAFTAIGLAWCVAWERGIPTQPWLVPEVRVEHQSDQASPFELGGRGEELHLFTLHCFRLSTFLLVVWSAAFLILRLRSPRPSIRRLARHPATSGCITAMVCLLVLCIEDLSTWCCDLPFQPAATATEYTLASSLNDVVKVFGGQAGPAIIATWCVLALAGRLRWERSWLEYFGLCLCAGWISILLEGAVTHLLGRL